MQRIDDPSNVPAKPAPLATVSPGYFRRPSVLAGDQGTIVTADFLNDVQETIIHPILASGGSLSKGAADRLTTAIASIANTLITSHAGVASTEGLSAHSRFATSAEVLAQAIGSVSISPLRLRQAFPSSLSNPGYIQLPTLSGNALLQFGSTLIASETLSQDVAFAVPYPNAQLVAFASSALESTAEEDNDAGARPHPSTPLTHVRLSTGWNARTVYWLSIGH